MPSFFHSFKTVIPPPLPAPPEWRRQQDLVGVLPPIDYGTDLRLKYDHVVRETWTHEQVRCLGHV